MKEKKRCEDCRQWLEKGSNECCCGWKYVNEQTYITDHRCLYLAFGRRCPLFATHSQSLYGKGFWYCLEHMRNLGNAKVCEEVLLEAEKNFESIMESRIDWRRRLFPEEYRISKALISLIAEHR